MATTTALQPKLRRGRPSARMVGTGKDRRPRRQFGMGSLFIALTILAIPLAFAAHARTDPGLRVFTAPFFAFVASASVWALGGRLWPSLGAGFLAFLAASWLTLFLR
jgi:hypothetical protein